MTASHALAEHCRFCTLADEMIRDRISVGPLDAKLSEKLQLDLEYVNAAKSCQPGVTK